MPSATSKLFFNILGEGRKGVFFRLTQLPRGGVLSGGTALALQIGHRISYDFDIFYSKPLPKQWLADIRKRWGKDIARVIVDTDDELTFILKPDIKITLLHYPFPALHPSKKTEMSIPISSLLDVASAKAYAIGRRGAWRDYVDMYFLLEKKNLSLGTIIREAEKRFGNAFDSKLFLQQLQYTTDIEDMSVEYIGEKISKKTIQDSLAGAVHAYIKEKITS